MRSTILRLRATEDTGARKMAVVDRLVVFIGGAGNRGEHIARCVSDEIARQGGEVIEIQHRKADVPVDPLHNTAAPRKRTVEQQQRRLGLD